MTSAAGRYTINPLSFVMYQIIRSHRMQDVCRKEAPAALAALLVAELFYRFHSFTLECLAFLATWYGFSWVFSRILRARRTSDPEPRP